MKEILITFLALTIGVFFLAGATLPLLMGPVNDTTATASNGTDLSYTINVTALATNYTRLNLASPDTARTAVATITWDKFGSNYVNVTSVTGTVQCGTVTTSPTFLCNITGSLLQSTLTLNFSSNSSHVQHAPNITNVAISYEQLPVSTQQGWDAGSVILYRVVVPLALIAALMLYFFS